MEGAANKLQETCKESTERQSREKINPNQKVTIWGVKMGFLPHYWGLQDAGTRKLQQNSGDVEGTYTLYG